MAKFSQGLISALTQPSYMDGMFNAGAAIGAAPGKLASLERLEEEKQRQAQMASLEATGADATAQAEAARLKLTTSQAIQTALKEGDTQAAIAIRNKALDPNMYLQKKAEMQMEGSAEDSGEWKSLGGSSNTLFNAATGETKTVDVTEAQNVPKLSPSDAAGMAEKGLITMDSFLEFSKGGFSDPSLLKKSDATEGEEEGKTAGSLASSIIAADNTIKVVDKALGLVDDVWPVPYIVSSRIPQQDAQVMKGYVETLQSNLAFDRLQRMRDESKTGGALGQVSNIELELLKGAIAKLDPSSKAFKDQLQVVRDHYTEFKRVIQGKKPNSENYQVLSDGNLWYKDLDTGELTNLGAFGE